MDLLANSQQTVLPVSNKASMQKKQDWWNDCMIHDTLWLATSSFDDKKSLIFIEFQKTVRVENMTDWLTTWEMDLPKDGMTFFEGI